MYSCVWLSVLMYSCVLMSVRQNPHSWGSSTHMRVLSSTYEYTWVHEYTQSHTWVYEYTHMSTWVHSITWMTLAATLVSARPSWVDALLSEGLVVHSWVHMSTWVHSITHTSTWVPSHEYMRTLMIGRQDAHELMPSSTHDCLTSGCRVLHVHGSPCTHQTRFPASWMQDPATFSNTSQHTATRYNKLQPATTHCNYLQHTATHCNMIPGTDSSRFSRPGM